MNPIYLNHLLVFVDMDTYRSIGKSVYLNEYFACSEERTTHDQASGISWAGRYYYGKNTYFEFMTPKSTAWLPRDALAFSIETKNGSVELSRHLQQKLDRQISLFKRSRRYKEQDVPWFWTTEISRKNDARLVSWVMEYDSDFLQEWVQPPSLLSTGTEQNDITRCGVLARYRSVIGDNFSKRLFRDISSVTVALPADEVELFDKELRIYGYVATELTGPSDSPIRTRNDPTRMQPVVIEKTVRYQGPDLEIVVDQIFPNESRISAAGWSKNGGITAFTMATKPVSVTTTHSFGPACNLTIHKAGMATWNFGASYNQDS